MSYDDILVPKYLVIFFYLPDDDLDIINSKDLYIKGIEEYKKKKRIFEIYNCECLFWNINEPFYWICEKINKNINCNYLILFNCFFTIYNDDNDLLYILEKNIKLLNKSIEDCIIFEELENIDIINLKSIIIKKDIFNKLNKKENIHILNTIISKDKLYFSNFDFKLNEIIIKPIDKLFDLFIK